jgi:hypothetical protein
MTVGKEGNVGVIYGVFVLITSKYNRAMEVSEPLFPTLVVAVPRRRLLLFLLLC